MIITLASFKGGVGKSTASVHLAAYFAAQAPTVLVDGDPNGSATRWAKPGHLPFPVVGKHQGPVYARKYEHLIIDTQARPTPQDLKDLAEGCDLLIIPATPDTLSLDALMLTIGELQNLDTNRYRVLLNIVPPDPIKEGRIAREALQDAGIPLFTHGIRRLMAFQRAAEMGLTVDKLRDERATVGWRDYESVAQEVERLTAQTSERLGAHKYARV